MYYVINSSFISYSLLHLFLSNILACVSIYLLDQLHSLLYIYYKYQTRRDNMSSKKRDYY